MSGLGESFETVIDIAASPDRVFDYFVQPNLLVQWMGDWARLNPTDGGLFAVDINGVVIRGTYVRVQRPHLIEIAWGEAGNAAMPPGATRLVIRLSPIETGTRLELVHSGLVPTEASKHGVGWAHFLARLVARGGGGDPGPDPWAPTLAGHRTPKASVFVSASLDGFIARRDGTLDFLPPDEGEPHGCSEFLTTVDALLIGRNTLDAILAFPEWPYGAMRVFVLTHRPLPAVPACAVVEPVSGAPMAVASHLSACGVEHVCVDGGETIQQFLRGGLVQRLIVTHVPVLIGDGIPLFGGTGRDLPLHHVGTRYYRSGLVQSEYEVLGAGAAQGTESSGRGVTPKEGS